MSKVKKYEGGNVVGVGPRGGNTAAAAPANHLPWYYPGGAPQPGAPAAAPFHHHHQAVPIYGYVHEMRSDVLPHLVVHFILPT